VIENMPSVAKTGFAVIDKALGFKIVSYTVDGSTPGPAVKMYETLSEEVVEP
jgi:hypothetical protein